MNMRKIYHLSTCDTCKRIIKEVEIPSSFLMQDIKKDEITVKQLEEMYALSGSYEALFSRRAKLYKERSLKDEKLLEQDFKSLIIEHYTFLKRPVILNNEEIFIGNSKKTVEAAKKSIKN
ncbi:MAG: arsenate reductase [Sediminicola sp.]|jgi:arsenate reductase|tara:strand:- start:40 stop:399 length:360 start_codon:yes stop_codon:yes gene_type:complete